MIKTYRIMFPVHRTILHSSRHSVVLDGETLRYRQVTSCFIKMTEITESLVVCKLMVHGLVKV